MINFSNRESIVDVLNSIIVKNQCRAAKEIHTLHPRGTNPKLFVCTTTSDEFRKIATEIQQLKEKENLQFSSIAVLARTQRACQEVQSALMKSNIPCSRKARESLVNLSKLKEVQDILAYFKLACKFDSSQQDKAFLRVINVPSRQLGKSAIESIQEYSKLRNLDLFVASCQLCGKGSSRLNPRHRKALESFIMCIKSMKNLSNERPLDALEKFLSISKYDDFIQAKSGKDSTKLSNLNLLKELMQKSEISTLQEFMDQLENPDEKSGILAYKPSNDFVTISTIHQSKGREWDCVFLCRFNEGILPLGSHPILNCKISNSESHSLEEERRLAYVAMSRAKRFLYISLSQVDRFGNSLSPSRFLDEIPQRLFEKTSMPVKPIQETSTTNSFVSASSLLSKNTPAKDQESSKPRKSSSSTAHSQKSSFFQPTLSSFMAKRQKSEESR